MPQIAQQEPVLSERGKVVQYANGNSAGKFFYKEYIKGERRYKSKEIVGASTIEQAKKLAALKEKGILTDEGFSAEKAKILNS